MRWVNAQKREYSVPSPGKIIERVVRYCIFYQGGRGDTLSRGKACTSSSSELSSMSNGQFSLLLEVVLLIQVVEALYSLADGVRTFCSDG